MSRWRKSWAVASAIACKYAVSGDEKLKAEATDLLAKARALPHEEASFKEYEERILHRLNTREVIDRKEYNRRYRPAAKGESK